MDGPTAYQALPKELREKASRVIQVVINIVKKELDECHQLWIMKGDIADDRAAAMSRAKYVSMHLCFYFPSLGLECSPY